MTQQGAWRPKVSDVVTALAFIPVVKPQTTFDDAVHDGSDDDDDDDVDD